MKSMLIGAAVAVALTGLAGAASAAPSEAKHGSCFLSSNWSGWHAPDDKTLYLRVNLHDIYRVDLSSASPMLRWPNAHLVNVMRGSSYICSPLDLQLSVADDGGIFAFNVPFEGSLPEVRDLYGYPYVSSVRMRSLASNDGYYILGLDGTVWAFGNARYFGSLTGAWAVDLMQAP